MAVPRHDIRVTHLSSLSDLEVVIGVTGVDGSARRSDGWTKRKEEAEGEVRSGFRAHDVVHLESTYQHRERPREARCTFQSSPWC